MFHILYSDLAEYVGIGLLGTFGTGPTYCIFITDRPEVGIYIMHFGGADRAIRECGRKSEDLV